MFFEINIEYLQGCAVHPTSSGSLFPCQLHRQQNKEAGFFFLGLTGGWESTVDSVGGGLLATLYLQSNFSIIKVLHRERGLEIIFECMALCTSLKSVDG